MIFKQWRRVLDGTKTQTRRLIQNKDKFTTISVSGGTAKCIKHDGRTKWYTGQTLSVQPGRGKKAVGRIRITKIKRERLQDITPQAAKAEGVDPYIVYDWGANYIGYEQAFVNLWDSIYKEPGKRWQDNPEVWVLTFELVGGS